MRFLLPVGGIVDHRFGILTTPSHSGVPAGIVAGMDWAADNEAFHWKHDETYKNLGGYAERIGGDVK